VNPIAPQQVREVRCCCLPLSHSRGCYTACGTGGDRFKTAPVAGKTMVALVQCGAAGHDHDTAPLSFRLPYLGRDIDAGFYSRKRTINQESSVSVLG
jgi:sarcosine oxidase subunit beta